MLPVACNGGSNKTATSSSSASQQSIDDLTTRVQRDEMLNAWIAIAALPVHDLDTTLQGGKIDGKYVPTLRTLIRELALTEFSPSIKPAAQQLHDDAVTLYQLRTFIAAVDEGSFSAAGRKLRRAQSVVSQTLANLEAQLGVKLFDRSARYPRLTEEGRSLLADARSVAVAENESGQSSPARPAPRSFPSDQFASTCSAPGKPCSPWPGSIIVPSLDICGAAGPIQPLRPAELLST